MSKIDTILFDWDGTLAQTLEVWLKTFKEAFALFDIHPEDREITSRFGNWQIDTELGVASEDRKTFKDYILSHVPERLEKVELYPGAKEVLRRLHSEGMQLGLVSTSERAMINAALSNSHVAELFDVIVAAEDTVRHKPDPAPIYKALELLNVDRETAIFVGDSDKDTGAASGAEMPLLLFAPNSHDIYYDLEALLSEPSVKTAFTHWNNFPFEQLN